MTPNHTSRAENWFAIGFVMPAALLVGVLMYAPMLGTFWESLFTTSFTNPEPTFIWFDTYAQMLDDARFWQVVENSFIWTGAVVLFQNVIGFAVALLLDKSLPGTGVVRSLVLLPWVLPGVVAAILWRFLYDPQLGLINSVAVGWGIAGDPVAWLADTDLAMASVVFAAVWKGFPFSAVIYLAALQTVDKEQVEAAVIDGATPWQRLIHVVIPSLRMVILLNMVLTTIFTFNYFDMVWVTTRGGPLDATHIFPTMIYELGFGQFRFGNAAAYGTMSVLVLAVFVAAYLFLSRQRGGGGNV